MPTRSSRHRELIRENFQTIWPVHLQGFANLLVHLRETFDGDLDLALVLAVIGSRTRNARWAPALAELGKMTRGTGPDSAQHPINIQSVADYSGIPRETVRRKVASLQDRGWVTRSPDGRLSVTRVAAAELQDATSETIDYLASLLVAFEVSHAFDRDHERR
jgi:CRP-like cAMP-binding protein